MLRSSTKKYLKTIQTRQKKKPSSDITGITTWIPCGPSASSWMEDPGIITWRRESFVVSEACAFDAHEIVL
ncbi:unnamed protein product, partial [Onchocerca ochengi]|uniref:Uncharacterized protein n=1 Tax=Onchocerca ochengi TaxID=42157 RepID=A0A182ERU5_ONCOC